jgi:hypothetical protein
MFREGARKQGKQTRKHGSGEWCAYLFHRELGHELCSSERNVCDIMIMNA